MLSNKCHIILTSTSIIIFCRMARRLADNIQSDHLSCPICRDILTDPRMLPCEHTLCVECLIQLIQSSRRLNKFSCPIDRQEITAPSYSISAADWAKSFPTDDLALLLIQTVSGDIKSQSPTQKTGIPCTNHPTNFCDFFCFGCSKFACSECAVEKHRKVDCICKPLSKCGEKAREKLKKACDEIESFIIIGQNVAAVEFTNDKTLIESRNKIEKSILNLKKIVQDFEKMALGKFVDIMQTAHTVVDRRVNRQRVEDIVDELNVLREEVERAKSMTSTTDMISVLTKIPDILDRCTTILFFDVDEQIELKLELNSAFLTLCEKLVEQPIGTIHVVTGDSLDCEETGDSLEFEDTEANVCGKRIQFASNVLPSRAAELVPLVVMKMESDSQNSGSTARFTDIIIHGHSIITVDNANYKLKRFRDRGENRFIDERVIPGIYGVTSVHQTDDIVVTAPQRRPHPCIIRIRTYNGLSTIVETTTEQPYYNICQLPDDKYGVVSHTVWNADPNKEVKFQWSRGVISHIDIINIAGQILSTLKESLLCEPRIFGTPCIMPFKSICGLPNGNIVISIETKSMNFISCVDQIGRRQWTYSLSDIPEGVCCHEDSIYIFLRKSKIVRVLTFAGHLKPISTFTLPNYKGDGNILFVNQTFLTIADKTDTIRMYRLHNV